MTSISIIIPCYNEENNLRRGVLDEVHQFLITQKFNYEVIICNDQSTDNSLQLAQAFAREHNKFKVYDFPKGGKPGAIWHGIQKAKYPLVLFVDMDQSTPLSEVKKLLPFYNQKYDIVIGSRGQERKGQSVIRQIGSQVFSTIRNLLLQTNISDTQCGFKSMKTDVALKLFPQLAAVKNNFRQTGWRVTAYDVELLFIANKLGYSIKEVPVKWKNEDTSDTKGDLNSRYFKESKQMAREVWRVFLNNLEGTYETKTN